MTLKTLSLLCVVAFGIVVPIALTFGETMSLHELVNLIVVLLSLILAHLFKIER